MQMTSEESSAVAHQELDSPSLLGKTVQNSHFSDKLVCSLSISSFCSCVLN